MPHSVRPLTFTLPAMLALLMMALPLSPANAEEDQRRTLSMTGSGEVSGAPENATISSGVTTEADTAAEALKANTEAMARAVAELKAAGIADRDLQTSNFSVSPRYFQDSKGNRPPRITGYIVSNQLTVIVRDLDKLGRILDEVVQVGSNQISGPNFGFEEPEKHLDIARARAAADAFRKARLYADALEIELGPVVSVNESGGGQPRPVMMRRMARAEAADVPIESGEIGLNAQVQVTWEIR